MKAPTLASVLDAAGVPLLFGDGLRACGVDVNGTIPMLDRTPVEPFGSAQMADYLRKCAEVGFQFRNYGKIPAIKSARSAFGMGLKEAKDFVEAFFPPGFLFTHVEPGY